MMEFTEKTLDNNSEKKSLRDLSPDDIMQLTREHCRQFLKEKGMRRPSWNKSQAVQQLLSLKSLLEPDTDDEGEQYKGNPSKFGVQKEDLHDTLLYHLSEKPRHGKYSKISKTLSKVNIEDPREKNTQELYPSISNEYNNTSLLSDNTAQLTIFYSGIVNVYDNVPAQKAQALLKLAEEECTDVPKLSLDVNNISDPATTWSSPQTPKMKHQSGTIYRKTIVQRYLNKRKYRLKPYLSYSRGAKNQSDRWAVDNQSLNNGSSNRFSKIREQLAIRNSIARARSYEDGTIPCLQLCT